MERNFSMQAYWDNKAKNWKPQLTFEGKTRECWEDWNKRAYPKLLELLGEFPGKVDMKPETEWSVEAGELIRERIVINTEENMSVPFYLLKRKDVKRDGSNAAILCCHGHGKFGKDPVAGVRSSEGREADIREMNYNYAEQMAKEGYVTLTPDLRVFGERRDGPNPFPGCDPCDINFVKGALFGTYTLTLNIWDMMRCIDYLETREEVDPSRIGMMGLSYGGTMTTFTAAIDKRIKAADIISYVNPFAEFAIKHANSCGSQVVPGLFRYFDTHDIAGLIAPRPLLLEMGLYDECFSFKELLRGYEGVKKIYEAAGAAGSLYADVHCGGHAFAGNKAFEFFRTKL